MNKIPAYMEIDERIYNLLSPATHKLIIGITDLFNWDRDATWREGNITEDTANHVAWLLIYALGKHGMAHTIPLSEAEIAEIAIIRVTAESKHKAFAKQVLANHYRLFGA